MKRLEINHESPKPPNMSGGMLPVHLPHSPNLPGPMLPVGPLDISESLERLATMAKGRAMDFKLMIQLPDGSQFYLESSMDK